MAKRSKKRIAVGNSTTSVASHAQEISWHKRDWFWGVILLAAVVLTYSPVWWAGYVWDDDTHLTANPCVVGPLGLREIWTTSAASIFPLTLTSFWFEHKLWALAPLPYHLVNVAQQAFCAVLLWHVLRSLRIPGAWFGAALWALHPLQVESVAWVSEMKNTQSCVFYLLTVLFYIRWLTLEGSRKSGDYVFVLLFAALAIASKFSVVVLPMVLALSAWWIQGRWRWRNFLPLLPILVMSAFAIAVTFWLGAKEPKLDHTFPPLTWPQRIATAGDVTWFYLGKLVWPSPQMAIYPRWDIDATQWTSYLPTLSVIVLSIMLWLKRKTWSRPYFFAFGYFLVVLSPFLGLINQSFWRYSFVQDHLQYLAAMGPCALAGAGLVRLTASPQIRGLVAAPLILILAIASWQRAWVYQSEETLWEDTRAKNASCWVAYNILGHVLFQQGHIDEALADFQKAADLNPSDPEALYNTGVALHQKGQPDESIAWLEKALTVNPNHARAHSNLGLILAEKGHLDEAIKQYRTALEIDPIYADAHCNLGIALFSKGDLDEAIAQLLEALMDSPDDFNAHFSIANVYFHKGQLDDAIIHYQRLLQLHPKNPDVHNNLGIVLIQKGDIQAAIDQFQEALGLNPSLLEAKENLSKARIMLQRVPEVR